MRVSPTWEPRVRALGAFIVYAGAAGILLGWVGLMLLGVVYLCGVL